MNWQQPIETTVNGLGYQLVDIERAPRGLLRVYIDRIPGRAYGEPGDMGVDLHAAHALGHDALSPGALSPGAPNSDHQADTFVTVEDCEKVTRQLQYALEVDAVAYERLEVSSPGLDRPLRCEADYLRFAGQVVNITLKQPFQGRKNWRGTLVPTRPGQTPPGWALQDIDGPVRTGGAGSGAGRAARIAGAADAGPDKTVQAKELRFALDEVREARLVPVLDFKGRRKPARPD